MKIPPARAPHRPFPQVSVIVLALVLIAGTLHDSAAAGEEPGGTRRTALTPLPLSGPLSTVPQAGSGGGDSPWWSRLYAAGFYDTRWDGWFLQSYFQQGYHVSADRKFSVYGIAWATADSRSDGTGPLPAIISDNILLLGAGIRFRPAQSFWIDLQEGVAFDLRERGGARETRHDFRLVATGGTGAYPEFRVHDDFRSPMSLMADFFASAGFYSRYENAIAYLQGRIGARVGEISTAFVDAYLRADVALDTEGDFYNNIFEIGPGLRFTPNPDWGLFLLVEYRRGSYGDYTDRMAQRRALFYPAHYDAVRFYLVLDREF